MPVIAKGLEGIIANSTALSDVRGEEGILIYAGYNINELAGKVSYEEVVYLLWHGELPNKAQLEALHEELGSQRELPQGIIEFILGAPKDSNPMDVIRTGVSMLGLYDKVPTGEIDPAKNRHRAVSITAKVGISPLSGRTSGRPPISSTCSTEWSPLPRRPRPSTSPTFSMPTTA